tara:strand:+ start:49 stop:213 length:165 start_codon:yes stop_codon:yes gene_type:complete
MNPFSDLITEDRDPSAEKEKVIVNKRNDASFVITILFSIAENTKKKSCHATILG